MNDFVNDFYQLSNKGWKDHHKNEGCIQKYPQEMVARMLSEFFDKDKNLLDLGSAYGKNSIPFANRFKKVTLVDPFISNHILSKISNDKNIQYLNIEISSFKDFEEYLDKDTVILGTYFFDHIPKYLGKNILQQLLNQRDRYTSLLTSFFLAESIDSTQIEIDNKFHYVRPIYNKCYQKLKTLKELSSDSNQFLQKLIDSGILIELHSYYEKSELSELYKDKNNLNIFSLKESSYDEKNLNINIPSISTDILYIKT